MIKIDRTSCPETLKKNPLTKNSYQEEEVQSKLLIMQFSKCAYCEKLLDQEKQIDHYRPQEEFVTGYDSVGKKLFDWTQANRWANLLFACKDCNRSKWQESPFDSTGERLLIDPSEPDIDPEDFIDFIIQDAHSVKVAVLVAEKDHKPLGKSTIAILKLNRKKHIGELKRLCIKLYNEFLTLLVYLKTEMDLNHTDCQDKLSYILRSMDSRTPFAAFSRAFVSNMLQSDEFRELSPELQENLKGNMIIPKGCKIT